MVERAGGPEGLKEQEGRLRYTASHTAEATTVAVATPFPAPLAVELRRVSGGMAQNVAIAVGAALRIGAKGEEIQKRLLSWRPSPLRGEWRISEGRRIYLDCYNANPVSMADALEAFDAVAPPGEPRLLVLGSMEELGADAKRYHVELGKSLALRGGDHAVAIGGHARDVLRGALEAGFGENQIEVADTIEQVCARVAGFRGSVFVKGSRRHELERVLAGAEFAEAPHA